MNAAGAVPQHGFDRHSLRVDGGHPGARPYRFVIHDRDGIFSKELDKSDGERVSLTEIENPSLRPWIANAARRENSSRRGRRRERIPIPKTRPPKQRSAQDCRARTIKILLHTS
jgi:hypothetical protein